MRSGTIEKKTKKAQIQRAFLVGLMRLIEMQNHALSQTLTVGSDVLVFLDFFLFDSLT